eukprot:COSAG01_NODE_8177_length_2890_cov_1.147976_4_plen_246_part_01
MFGFLLLLKALRSGANATGTLVDVVTLRIVSGTGENYGKQRLWTSVAWGVGSVAAGYAIDAYGFDAIFVWYYAFTGLTLVLLLACPFGGADSTCEASSRDGSASDSCCTGPVETIEAIRSFIVAPAGAAKQSPRTVGGGGGDAFRRFLGCIVVASVVMSLLEGIVFLQMERDFHSPVGDPLPFPLARFVRLGFPIPCVARAVVEGQTAVAEECDGNSDTRRHHLGVRAISVLAMAGAASRPTTVDG